MESLRKAFGFSKDRVEKEGDAFDRDLQEDLKRRRREDRDEALRDKEANRVKEAKRREKEAKRREKERKEAIKLRERE